MSAPPSDILLMLSDKLRYTVPKGSLVLLNVASALHDAKTWGDPDNFRPERFLDADSNPIKDPKEFIPFVQGKRFCLGDAMAKTELFLCLSAVFQHFRFEAEDSYGKLPPLEGTLQLVFVPEETNILSKLNGTIVLFNIVKTAYHTEH
ncbi:hypothetical protein RRG08_022048 [Elysia crispata]|uniref:Cytochrome P450 n=1 Tax=Elysia crispata TaxID=231223 RepID=A0AAE1D6C8_9GAST|nr:hypothetical protein RRG08_022048 [Elysia crispata]